MYLFNCLYVYSYIYNLCMHLYSYFLSKLLVQYPVLGIYPLKISQMVNGSACTIELWVHAGGCKHKRSVREHMGILSSQALKE